MKTEKRITEAKQIWEELSDIPIDNNDEIETDFSHWEKGTNKIEIWKDIEEIYGVSIVNDLMFS